MPQKYLATYLNDHLAGSVIAVDLLWQLQRNHPRTKMADMFSKLRAHIEEDRKELKSLMDRFGIREHRSRKAAAWSAGKVAKLKLSIEDDKRGPLRLLETVEAIALGIDGKIALWRALGAAAEVAANLRQADFERLRLRAEKQRQQVETIRLKAAKLALV